MQIFAVKEETSSEIVWNDETRRELFDLVEIQLADVDNVFSHFLGFKYQVNKVELKVEEIFIRHYNKPTDKYHPTVPESFSNSILNQLKPYLHSSSIGELSPREFDEVLNLVSALYNIFKRE